MRAMSLSRWKLPAVVMMTCGLAAGAIVAASPVTKPDAPLGPAPRTAQPADPPPAVERNEDLWVWQQRPAPVEEVGPVLSVAFAPNGQSFLTAGDGRVRLWTTNTLEPTTVAGNRTGLTRSAVAISTDGKSIAVVTPDGAQGMSFPVAGEAVQTLWVLRDVSGSAIAFSPDGKRVAVSDGLTLRAKDLPPASGEVSFGPLVNAVKNGAVAAVAWSPDGKRVVFLPNLKIDPEWPASGTASPDPAKATHWHAQIWGAGSGETMAFLKHGTSRLTALGWSADGSTIATADVDGGIVLWDGKTLAEKSRLKAPGEITCLALRADGKRLVAGVRGAAPKEPNDPASAPQVVVFTEWEPAKNWLESSTMGGPVGETVRGLAFSPDGKVLIGGTEGTEGKSGGLRVWDRVFLKAAGK